MQAQDDHRLLSNYCQRILFSMTSPCLFCVFGQYHTVDLHTSQNAYLRFPSTPCTVHLFQKEQVHSSGAGDIMQVYSTAPLWPTKNKFDLLPHSFKTLWNKCLYDTAISIYNISYTVLLFKNIFSMPLTQHLVSGKFMSNRHGLVTKKEFGLQSLYAIFGTCQLFETWVKGNASATDRKLSITI